MSRVGRLRAIAALGTACLLSLPGSSWAAVPATIALLGIPIDFILFGITLAGVALLYRHTLQVALVGLSAIVAYKLRFTGFKTGPGIEGLIAHLGQEWVILSNLLLLLVG